MEVDEESKPRHGMTKITAVVDSGASVSVLPKEMIPEVPIASTPMSRAGKTYKAAGG